VKKSIIAVFFLVIIIFNSLFHLLDASTKQKTTLVDAFFLLIRHLTRNFIIGISKKTISRRGSAAISKGRAFSL